MRSVIENYYLIVDILAEDGRHDLVTKLNYSGVRSLVKFLEPFETLTKKMSAELNTTFSQVWPSVAQLRKSLEDEGFLAEDAVNDETDEPISYMVELEMVKSSMLECMAKKLDRNGNVWC